MTLVQEQYKQGSRKNHDNITQPKLDNFKQYHDHKDLNYGCNHKYGNENCDLEYEENIVTSGNVTEDEDIFYEDPNELLYDDPESQQPSNWRKTSKNVRFEDSDLNSGLESSETSSVENELQIVDCCYGDHRRSLSQEPVKVKEQMRLNKKSKWHKDECYEKKNDRRPKSSPEKSSNTLDNGWERRTMSFEKYCEVMKRKLVPKKKEHRCGRSHGSAIDHRCGESMVRKGRCNLERGDDGMRHHYGDCCDFYYPLGNEKSQSHLKIKPSQKHLCCSKDVLKETIPKPCRKHCPDKQMDNFAYYATTDHHCPLDEYHDIKKSKKAILEAVQEQQEQLSDSTYKVPCSKYSNQTVLGDSNEMVHARSVEKFANDSPSDWFHSSKKNYMEKINQPPRLHKMRSRRTRMKRMKNGWRKALVQTVRDGNRNEKVGVIVMGPQGLEYYSKNQSNSQEAIRNKSLEGGAACFDVMTVDCKNVYLSSSEPRTSCVIKDLASPEDDSKVDEKLANFSKNVNDILKTSEEKFYKALSTKEFQEKHKPCESIFLGAGEGSKENEKRQEVATEETKNSSFSYLPFESFSPRVPKTYKKREKKINEQSKTKADLLNEQAKKYKEKQLNLREKENSIIDSLKELQEKFPTNEVSVCSVKTNEVAWGKKSEQSFEVTESLDCENEQLNSMNRKNEKSNQKQEANEKILKEDMRLRETDQYDQQQTVNKQKSRKYFETIEEASVTFEKDGEDAPSRSVSPSKSSRKTSSKWPDPCNGIKENKNLMEETDSKISQMFRDLVENGCAISKGEFENLQTAFNHSAYNEDLSSNRGTSEVSSTELMALHEQEQNVSPPSTIEESELRDKKLDKKNNYHEESKSKKNKKLNNGDEESFVEEEGNKKISKSKSHSEQKSIKKLLSKGKIKKKSGLEDRMKRLREALPGIADEKEATHLKQLKKYIDKFIERVEASTSVEVQKKRHSRHKSTDSISTDSSEIKVDARKILDIVSNPFKTISSDVTINIARKLTDALVQEKTNKEFKYSSSKSRQNLENGTDEGGGFQYEASSGSDQCEEPEPYLKQLKKKRNDYLNNIVLEVKKLHELLRFLDRCTRLSY